MKSVLGGDRFGSPVGSFCQKKTSAVADLIDRLWIGSCRSPSGDCDSLLENSRRSGSDPIAFIAPTVGM